ncbi:MAG: phenylacetate--CoA ligase family protein [Phycisphaerae bacterium]
MPFHRPEVEQLGEQALRALQREKLSRLLQRTYQANPFYRAKLAEVGADPSACSVADLPFTTRAEIEADQQEHPPYGTNLAGPKSAFRRLHQTSGSTGEPVRWLDTPASWAWWLLCWRTIFRAGGIDSGDRFFFPFSFGPFIGFWAAFEAATEMGAFCLPAGGMTTVARLRYLIKHDITVLCCTPTYALRLADVARAEGIDVAHLSVRAIVVAGEPGGNIPSTRSRIESAFGARVLDHAGMTECGAWGFECIERPGGLHVLESEFIAEVIDPETGAPVPDGVAGELVLTNLGRTSSPLIRYRTGDRVRWERGACACGRCFAWLPGGVLGRVDDMILIRGNNVFPAAIENIVRAFDDVAEFAIEVKGTGDLVELVLSVEARPDSKDGRLGERIAETIQHRLHFRPSVVMVEDGSLPRFDMKAKRVIRSTWNATDSPGDGRQA